MSLSNAKLTSLKDKLADVEANEVPVDVPVVEAKKVEEKGVKKEIKKVKSRK